MSLLDTPPSSKTDNRASSSANSRPSDMRLSPSCTNVPRPRCCASSANGSCRKVSRCVRRLLKQASSLKHQQVELASNRNLLKDGFVSLARISQLEAGVADYAAKLEEKRSEVARAEQRLIDVDLRIKSLEGEYRQQASDQVKVTTTRIAEIQEELRKVRDASVRQLIVAPAAGDVMDLKFNAAWCCSAPARDHR